tara:strand:- start:2241 stop:2936 length:696 start_codon:yes stop_codon:yes gene_type:complete
MTFWTKRLNPVVPYQKHKFFVEFVGAPSNNAFWIYKTNLPKITREIEYKLYQLDVIPIPGKSKWSEITMEIYDWKQIKTATNPNFFQSNSFDTNSGGVSEALKWYSAALSTLDSDNLKFTDEDKTSVPSDIKENSNYITPGETFENFLSNIKIYKVFTNARDYFDKDNPTDINKVHTECWTLTGCHIKEIDWGDVDYSSEDINTIKVTIAYNNATLKRELTEPPKNNMPVV